MSRPGPAAVSVVLAAGGEPAERVAGELFPGAAVHLLDDADLRPSRPFDGSLFEILARVPRAACVGLVVPVVWRGPAGEAGATAPLAPGALLAVSDHVNLELRGPLSGWWPSGVPRAFPATAGIYQPAVVRAAGGPRVYSSGVVVAGVADAGRLTPFEARSVREAGILAVSDCLVPPAIVAAYNGLTLAACGVPPADDRDEE